VSHYTYGEFSDVKIRDVSTSHLL